MPFKNGDFLIVEHTAKVKETGEVFDTTSVEIAKKERLDKEGELYEPKLVVVGEGWVIKALDESLQDLELNKLKTVEIPPDKAFGSRDPEKMKTVPLRRLRDKGLTPQIGMRIEYEKKQATVRTVGAGRVTLDYNPPLAGKTLLYEVTVKKRLGRREDKMRALIHRRIPIIDVKNFGLELGKSVTTIHVPEEAFYLEGIQLSKRGIAADIHHFFPAMSCVEFIETIKNPKAKTRAAIKKEKPKASKREKPKARKSRKRSKKRNA
ncbi:MAG: peptidylprolyl isomerase [Candidatus Bathyarchaeota archaeon]|nr:MAG: peptidylprolyl isomerase [Candidatus Bathyarchaeota archaeon]